MHDRKPVGFLKSGSASRRARKPRREPLPEAVSGRWCEGRGRSRGRWMVNAAEELF